MKYRIARVVVGFLALVLSPTQLTLAQTPAETASGLPRLVRFAGTVKDLSGNPLTGVVGITFALYSGPTGSAALWLETQNVTADSSGHYTALLGSTKPDGLPADLFTSEQARWVGVQISGQAEQPRVLLVSSPYAFKAGDAETVGGLPASAFVLAAPPLPTSTTNAETPAATAPQPLATGTTPVTTAGGTVNKLAKFDAKADITNSLVFDNGTNVGIGNIAPAAKLDVSGTGIFRGALTLPATGTATAAAGTNSQSLNFTASSFNKSTLKAVNETFRWQGEPVGNNSATPLGKLNLLFGSGTATPTETGLSISSKGQITFTSGQTFPSSVGTVKSVGLSAPSSDFTVSGSPVTTSGTLELNWKVPPTSSNTANAIVKRDANGAFTAGGITSTSATGVGVVGQSSGTNAVADGVDGVTGSATASGVAGINNSRSLGAVGVYGTGGIGVYGTSSDSVGAWGQFGTLSGTGSFLLGNFETGVFADGGTTGGFGVEGTTDDGVAGYLANNSVNYAALEVYNFASGGVPFYAFNGWNSTGCYIDGSGNLNCTGSKNAVVPIDGGKRRVAMSAIESPKNWFEDAGDAELVNGSAVVTLDPDFIQTVNTNLDYHVFLTPNGDSRGLYVTRKTAASFEVREQGAGTSSIGFDYRVMALRKNYENVRFADHTNDPDPRKMMERLRSGKQQVRPAAKSPIPLAPLGSASSLRSAQTPPGP